VAIAVLAALSCCFSTSAAEEEALLGHWPLAGDSRDHSGGGRDAKAISVSFESSTDGGPTAGRFDGRGAYLEVPAGNSIPPGTGDFTIGGWIHTDEVLDDSLGDIAASFDPRTRTGFSLGIMNYAGVTSSQANHRHLSFGIDAGTPGGPWVDRGRPGNAVLIYSLAVFDGHLYAGTCEAGVGESGHVYRYEEGVEWTDCGSPDPCNSVSALVEHGGRLYAGVSRYRLRGSALADSENPHLGGKVYRYEGGQSWADCGQLLGIEAINGLVVYKGALYASSTYAPAGLFRYEGESEWTACPTPDGKRVEALTIHDGHLYATGYDEGAVYRFDGQEWTHLGVLGDNTQTYSFATYQGRMHVGTWRSGKVFRLDGEMWTDVGRLGNELEVMGMAVYNGQLYAGTLPLAEVYRYDGGTTWARTGQLDATPDVMYRRAWTMAVFDGQLFCGTLPSGRVLSFEAGRCVTSHKAIPPGWCHIAAVKEGGRLKLYVQGELAATSTEFDPAAFDLSNRQPLTMGFGPHDYFNGQLRDMRLYGQALPAAELAAWAER
jgi:hypothetical protein